MVVPLRGMPVAAPLGAVLAVLLLAALSLAVLSLAALSLAVLSLAALSLAVLVRWRVSIQRQPRDQL